MSSKYSIGSVFGPYTVLSEPNKEGRVDVVCNTCGSTSSVFISNINRQRMCVKCRTAYNTKPREDLSGRKYGMLTVIKSIIIDGHTRWECKCDCGNTTIVETSKLKSGHTKSCGCYAKMRISEANSINLEQCVFGRLFVERKGGGHITPAGQRLTTYICKCSCGNEVETLAMNLVSGNTISCGCVGCSAGETVITDTLVSYGIKFKRQVTFRDLKTSRGGLPKFDFAVQNKDGDILFLIEFNGEQHYYEEKQTNFGKLQRDETDELKARYCNEKGIKLYVIRYDDDICQSIKTIVRENKLLNI